MLQSKWFSLFLLLLIASISGIASDIYAPSIPAISEDFKTSINNVQSSMAIYLLGMALFQLVYGTLSDALGRKPILIGGLFLFFIGTLLCYNAPTFEILMIGRVIQGIGAAAPTTLWRATFRDLFAGEEMAKYGSYLGMFMVLVVPAAPIIGGALQSAFGWRSSFLLMSIYSLFLLILILFFRETSQHHHKHRLKPSFIYTTYRDLLKNPLFMGYSIAVFLTYGAFFSWFAVGPVLLIDHLGYSPLTFGTLSSLALCGSMSVGSFFNGKLVQRFGLFAMLRFGWLLTFLSGLALALGYWVFGLHLYAILIPILFFYVGAVFIFGNSFAGAFAHVGKIAGFASALYGTLQTGGGAFLGALVSYLPDATPLPLASVYIGCSLSAWLIYRYIVRPLEQHKPPH